MLLWLPRCPWPAASCKCCRCCPASPASYSDASALWRTWCRPCCPDLGLRSSAIRHWGACWRRSAEEPKGIKKKNIQKKNIKKTFAKSFSPTSQRSEFSEKDGKEDIHPSVWEGGKSKVMWPRHHMLRACLRRKRSYLIKARRSFVAGDKARCLRSCHRCQPPDLCFCASLQTLWVIFHKAGCQARGRSGAVTSLLILTPTDTLPHHRSH